MSTMALKITGVSIFFSTVCWGADQRKHQSSALLARWLADSPHKRPVTRKMFPFDDVIMRQNNPNETKHDKTARTLYELRRIWSTSIVCSMSCPIIQCFVRFCSLKLRFFSYCRRNSWHNLVCHPFTPRSRSMVCIKTPWYRSLFN